MVSSFVYFTNVVAIHMTPIFEGCMARLVAKNGCQKGTYFA